MQTKLSKEQISEVFKLALKQKSLLNEDDTAAVFYDLSFLKERIEDLVKHFPGDTLHAIAVKANPLVSVLKQMQKLNVGLEAASIPELYLAQQAGFDNKKIVYDSPVKTIGDIEYALNSDCHINADSIYELDRIEELFKKRKFNNGSTIGIRINPQVGTGSIASTSTAGEYSKFGVPLKEFRNELIKRFEKYDWLTGVHLHIGSQGCPVELLMRGIGKVLNFAEEVNRNLQKKNARHKINIFDIGGGLPVSYHSNSQAISMGEYADKLKLSFHQLFDGSFKLITEFGRYIHANTGWAASKVEYVKRESEINTAMIHVGADMFVRKSYQPDLWHHEIFVLDKNGNIKTGTDKNKYVIAGPLCFSGDKIAKDIELPVIEEGDYIIIRDTGAYTLSMWLRYNSRQMPKVIGYRENGREFEILKERETEKDILIFWS